MALLQGRVRLIEHMAERVAHAGPAIIVEEGNGFRQDIDGILSQELLALLRDAQRHGALVLGGTRLLQITQSLELVNDV
jgi:hypothetical protein